jgi:hypothetical protein
MDRGLWILLVFALIIAVPFVYGVYRSVEFLHACVETCLPGWRGIALGLGSAFAVSFGWICFAVLLGARRHVRTYDDPPRPLRFVIYMHLPLMACLAYLIRESGSFLSVFQSDQLHLHCGWLLWSYGGGAALAIALWFKILLQP